MHIYSTLVFQKNISCISFDVVFTVCEFYLYFSIHLIYLSDLKRSYYKNKFKLIKCTRGGGC